MNSIKWEFPHPLLADGRDDYSIGSFSLIEGTHGEEGNLFIFSFQYELNCPGLEKYIDDGKADVILNVASSASKYRNQFHFDRDSKSLKVRIAKNDIAKTVEFTAFIVARGDTNFSLLEHNALYYNGASFSLRKGDMLALSSTIIVQIDDSQLQKPIASIFTISEDTKKTGKGADAFFDDDKIVVFLSSDSYKKYDLLKKRHPHIRRSLSAIITLPALVNAIELMKDEDSRKYENLRWYKSIYTKLAKEVDLDSEDFIGRCSVELANLIYGDIVFDALTAIQTVLDRAIDPTFQELGGID